MRIVYISSSTIPSRAANSIHVMKMCQAFAKNGHEVVLLAPDDKKNYESGVDDVFGYYGVEQCFEIVKLPWPNLKGKGYLYGVLAALKARQLKPDLVFGRNTIGCALAASAGLPVMFESHSPIAENGRIGVWLFDKLSQHANLKKFIVITHTLKGYYLSTHSHLAEKIHVAPDGAAPVSPDVEPVVLPNAGKRLQVGYVGHLYQGKGMEVVAEMVRFCGWADFHVVGGKENDLAFWKEQVADVQNITFYGFVPHGAISSYIKSFDVVLLPNQPEVKTNSKDEIGRWTSPLKMFEYMAAQKPIICSDLSVLREVLTDEVNCLLCRADDIRGWVAALSRLDDEKGLGMRIAHQALRDFLGSYTWQARAKALIGDRESYGK